MTGFGKAETPFRGHKLICEIRSLNSKSMDLSVRLAAPLRAHELELRTIVNQRLERGKVDLAIYEDSETKDSDAGYTRRSMRSSIRLSLPVTLFQKP